MKKVSVARVGSLFVYALVAVVAAAGGVGVAFSGAATSSCMDEGVAGLDSIGAAFSTDVVTGGCSDGVAGAAGPVSSLLASDKGAAATLSSEGTPSSE